jgi:uncharacterized membrane protein YkvI
VCDTKALPFWITGLVALLGEFLCFISGDFIIGDKNTSAVSAIFSKLNMKWLYVIFEIVLFGTLIETGAGFIKAVDDRIEITSARNGEATPTWVRPVIAIGLTLIGVAVSTFGLTGLIAKGYGTVCWGFLIVYVIPMLTIGIYKISKAGK